MKSFDHIVTLHGTYFDEFERALDKGYDAALEYLQQWSHGEVGEQYGSAPWGTKEDQYESGDYVMSSHRGLSYASLYYKGEMHDHEPTHTFWSYGAECWYCAECHSPVHLAHPEEEAG